ncbi:MAG: hypothetical protein R2698_12305 [Microthrixaceae bacterium]
MFVQVFQGRTNDPEALRGRMEVWQEEVQPGATGYLGSTGGVTSDGDAVFVARFESAEAADRNSRRPEQSAWWSGTEQCFDGPVSFHDSVDVQEMDHGDRDRARFVQVMEGHISDPARARALHDSAGEALRTLRPDLLGSIVAYHGEDAFTEVAYFTSESEARQAEANMAQEMPAEFADFDQVMKVERYLDLTDPWLVSAHPA